jgi:hypothetical protein
MLNSVCPPLLLLHAGSADFMEWAALYASRKGYKFWRSFTTGTTDTYWIALARFRLDSLPARLSPFVLADVQSVPFMATFGSPLIWFRSFSCNAGKPPSLGGVPHDVFGMTTRGVHR